LLAGAEDRLMVESVLHTLAMARLITLGTGPPGSVQVEVAHEALIREWPVLARWLAEERACSTYPQRTPAPARHRAQG
jgi:hypothetical protein